MPEDQWVHIAAVANASAPVIEIYWNAVLVEKRQLPSDSIAFANPAAAFLLGYQAESEGRFYIGELDEVAVWNGEVLTEGEIMELYQLGQSGEGLNPP